MASGQDCLYPAGSAESACEFAFRVGLQVPEMRLAPVCANRARQRLAYLGPLGAQYH